MGASRTSTSTPLIVIESGSDISKIAMRQNSASDSLGAGTKVFIDIDIIMRGEVWP